MPQTPPRSPTIHVVTDPREALLTGVLLTNSRPGTPPTNVVPDSEDVPHTGLPGTDAQPQPPTATFATDAGEVPPTEVPIVDARPTAPTPIVATDVGNARPAEVITADGRPDTPTPTVATDAGDVSTTESPTANVRPVTPAAYVAIDSGDAPPPEAPSKDTPSDPPSINVDTEREDEPRIKAPTTDTPPTGPSEPQSAQGGAKQSKKPCRCQEATSIPEDQRRNLVVCIDGTANQFGLKNTHVVELYSRLEKNDKQLTYYDSGIGTFVQSRGYFTRLRQRIEHGIDMAIAIHLQDIALSAYQWLSENYKPGDRIYLFGFSRGAYQVRIIAGMINMVGLLHKGNVKQIVFAYQLYEAAAAAMALREKAGAADAESASKQPEESRPETRAEPDSNQQHAKGRKTEKKPLSKQEEDAEHTLQVCEQFKGALCHQNVIVHFLGAWDTVSSVGFMRGRVLPETTTGMHFVCVLRHALALDELRVKFLPEYAHGGRGLDCHCKNRGHSDIKEVWFAGSHSDVGGGNTENIHLDRFVPPLRWMLYEAMEFGLNAKPRTISARGSAQHKPSMNWFWRLLEYMPVTRLSYHGNDTEDSVTWPPHLFAGRIIQPGQLIHVSVLEFMNRNRQLRAQELERTWGQALEQEWEQVLEREWEQVLERSLTPVSGMTLYQALEQALERALTSASAQQNLEQTLEQTLRSHRHQLEQTLGQALDTVLEQAQEQAQTLGWQATMQVLERLEVRRKQLEEPGRLGRWAVRRLQRRLQTGLQLLGSEETEPGDTRESNGLDQSHENEMLNSSESTSDVETWAKWVHMSISQMFLNIFTSIQLTVIHLVSHRMWKLYRPVQLELDYLPHARPPPEFGTWGAIAVLDPWDHDYRKLIVEDLYTSSEACLGSIKRAIDERRRLTRHEVDPLLGLSSTDGGLQSLLDVPQTAHILFDILDALDGDKDGSMFDPSLKRSEIALAAVRTLSRFQPHPANFDKQVPLLHFHRQLRSLVPGAENKVVNSSVVRIFGSTKHQTLKGHDKPVLSVAYSPDGKLVVSASGDKTIRLWDAQTGHPVGEPLRGHTGDVRPVAFSPDGARIASGSDDKTIRIWDVATQQPVGSPLTGHDGYVLSVAFFPDGKHIVSGSVDKTVRVWDAETGSAVGEPLRGRTIVVQSVAISPDGRQIASGSGDETVRIWDFETREAVRVLEGHSNMVWSVAFTPDGKRVVSGSWDCTIRVWDVESGETILGPLRGHDDEVNAVAVSPDGKFIASGACDATVRLWDAETGEPVGEPLRGHTGWVFSVAFSPDGRRIVSGSRDNTVMIWDVDVPASTSADTS